MISVGHLFVLLALAAASIGSAQVPATQASGAAPAAEEQICENLTVIGSRVAKKRVCATRAQWAERRRQDRADVEQVQRPSGSLSNCSVTRQGGTPTC